MMRICEIGQSINNELLNNGGVKKENGRKVWCGLSFTPFMLVNQQRFAQITVCEESMKFP